MLEYIIAAILLYILSYSYYFGISHGMGNKAMFLQMRRFVPCALLAVLPAALVKMPLFSPLFIIPTIIAFLWIVTYPTLYYISNHKVSSDFEFHFEAVFGLYFIAWISSIGILASNFAILTTLTAIILTVIESIMLFIPAYQWIYYFLYRSCIDENGMQMILETHYNEIIEFFKSMPLMYNILNIVFVVFSIYSLGYFNFQGMSVIYDVNLYSIIVISAILIFLTLYLWKKKHGVFVRTGIVEFYLDNKEYMAKNKLYLKNLSARIADLKVESLAKKSSKPSTIVLVIGESASRDYMKAFNEDYHLETTPWLSSMKTKDNFILFPNAFSNYANTVIALSNALTEMNQYNDKKFVESCSFIDIAHKLGYKVHWYSNQGHLGCADTPVSLIAETADVAKWTKQKLNTIQYDESLLSYLDELDPSQNNLLVVHLKGSHFNFLNRYPAEFTKFGKANHYDLEPNYANSIAYTDDVLKNIYEYVSNKLNLQAMVYCSDHGTLPDKRRSPNFEGLGIVRIPMFTYFADEYIKNNQQVYETLVKHQNYYWTNDLLYELLCSIFNVKSNAFDETNSLASPKFKYKREDLRTHGGQFKI